MVGLSLEAALWQSWWPGVGSDGWYTWPHHLSFTLSETSEKAKHALTPGPETVLTS